MRRSGKRIGWLMHGFDNAEFGSSNIALLLYYITDRQQFRGSEAERRKALLECMRLAAAAGVNYIQLREKDLSARELFKLAEDARAAVRIGGPTKLLINSRIDVAIACAADGVHLRSEDISASDARVVFHRAGDLAPVLAVSCHSLAEVQLAESHGADLVVYGPVFEKGGDAASGQDCLAEVCRVARIPVLAIGGVTAENAVECIRAGARGIAGIRLFQQAPEEISKTVGLLRESAGRL